MVNAGSRKSLQRNALSGIVAVPRLCHDVLYIDIKLRQREECRGIAAPRLWLSAITVRRLDGRTYFP